MGRQFGPTPEPSLPSRAPQRRPESALGCTLVGVRPGSCEAASVLFIRDFSPFRARTAIGQRVSPDCFLAEIQ